MKTALAMLALVGSLIGARAQSTNGFPLWPDGAPGALGKAEQDIPTLTPYFPEAGKATGAAMIICPGGGYAKLAPHEGRDYARWLNQSGITCFVLKYRLGTDGYRHPAMLQDGARAVRLVRARATEWQLDPKRVGIIGSSAGGHLASTLMVYFDAGNSNAVDVIEHQSSRPDLAILCYPVITMGTFAHQGSKNYLLGTNAPSALVQELSTELHITKDAPPCFLWATDEDKTVPVENSLQFADALRQAGVPFELHVYEHGKHGLGLGSRDDATQRHPWTAECLRWLKERGFAKTE
jgi:acetyl esterase/lipase